ncbi:MAG: ROK family glucokinase [Candidatus Izemoplasmatales bacterium]|jgi:glucokinase
MMKKYLIGIDVGGTAIKIGQFDLAGVMINKWDLPTNKTDCGQHILPEISHFLNENINLEEVKGIGFGVPGPVTAGVIKNGVNLGWDTIDVVGEFSKLLTNKDIIVKVSNDANVAAAGETFCGAAQGYQNVCLFTIGTGVGGGIIIMGKLIDGHDGMGGEVGHMLVDQKRRFLCNCGKSGCLETVASATGIINLAKLYRIEDPTSKLNRYDRLSAKMVFDFAKKGDRIALRVVDEATNYLAYAFSLVTLVVNPDIFVIGGGVSYAGQFLIDKIESQYYQYVTPFISHAKFALAQLGNEAGMYGAAYQVR